MSDKILLGFEEGFLIGLIEGEGCIKHFRHSSRHGKYKTRFPSLSISNSDMDLLEFAKNIFDKIGIHSHIFNVHVAGDGEGTNHACRKNTYELRVVGYKNFIPLLPILDKLVSHHRKMQLTEVSRLIRERDDRIKKHNEQNQFILSKIREGESVPQIAYQVDLKPHYIHEWLRRQGLNVSKVRMSGK